MSGFVFTFSLTQVREARGQEAFQAAEADEQADQRAGRAKPRDEAMDQYWVPGNQVPPMAFRRNSSRRSVGMARASAIGSKPVCRRSTSRPLEGSQLGLDQGFSVDHVDERPGGEPLIAGNPAERAGVEVAPRLDVAEDVSRRLGVGQGERCGRNGFRADPEGRGLTLADPTRGQHAGNDVDVGMPESPGRIVAIQAAESIGCRARRIAPGG